MYTSLGPTTPLLFALTSLCLPQQPAEAQTNVIPATSRPAPGPLPSATTIHHFPNGYLVENLAIRSNGGILLNLLYPSPQVIYVDPFASQPTPDVLVNFPLGSAAPSTAADMQPVPTEAVQSTNHSGFNYGASGIVELYPDVFYVATTEWNVLTAEAPRNGTGQVWKIDLTSWNGKQSITPELLATFPHANFLDGMAAIPGTDTLLIADPNLGRVWRINVKSKKIDVAIENNYTKPEPSTGIGRGPLGVNGVHYQAPYLYFTNSNKVYYGRISVDNMGTPTGPVQILESGAFATDDFGLVPNGNGAAYLTEAYQDLIWYSSGVPGTPLNGLCDVKGPTDTFLGRRPGDEKTLYISTTGEDADYTMNPIPVGGSIVKCAIP